MAGTLFRSLRPFQSVAPTKIFMSLPPELLDEILGYLPPDYQSLRNCSLVAKSWSHPCRKRLFENVFIRYTNFQSWLGNISPTNIELLQHVRSLYFVGSFPWQLEPSSKHTSINDLYAYFPSFCRLHAITLSHLPISSDIPQQIEAFSPCQQALSSLTLAIVSLSWRSFIALIDYFPNLRYLELRNLFFKDGGGNPPLLSRPVRGKLCFHPFHEVTAIAFSDWLFAELGVEYDELVVDADYSSAPYSQRIIAACRKSLKCLKLGLRECFVLRTVL